MKQNTLQDSEPSTYRTYLIDCALPTPESQVESITNLESVKYHPTQRRKDDGMNIFRLNSASVVLTLALAGCAHNQTPQDLKEKAAQATAEVKSDAQQASVEVKSDAKALAEGVREGWNRDNPLDLSGAARRQLSGLPGITAAEADRMIAGRPTTNPGSWRRAT